MATKTRAWTRADLARMPDDGNRYEVLNGELLVTPQASYDHQQIVAQLWHALHGWCDLHNAAHVAAPGAVIAGDNELQPDIQVIAGPRRPRGTRWEELPPPWLVVEVLSDSTRRRDRRDKRDEYPRHGVSEYWIVDPDSRDVTVVRPGRGDQRESDVLHWQPRPELPELEIPLTAVFR